MKIHYAIKWPHEDSVICGTQRHVAQTSDRKEVTCKRCLGMISLAYGEDWDTRKPGNYEEYHNYIP
jgi:hypothetical protein